MGSPGSNNPATAARIGLSEPISTGGPSESDVVKTRELEKVGSLPSWVLLYVFCWALVYWNQLCNFIPKYSVMSLNWNRNSLSELKTIIIEFDWWFMPNIVHKIQFDSLAFWSFEFEFYANGFTTSQPYPLRERKGKC